MEFRVINKSDNIVLTFRAAKSVAAFLLGCRIDNFIVVKSDEIGDRVIKFSSNECKVIESELIAG